MSKLGGVSSVRILAFAALVWLFVLPAGGSAAPPTAERRMVVVEGADYFGLDYDVLKEVELAACESACLVDARCKAFTYNTKARWCFLKSEYGDLRPFAGAVSGHIAPGAESAPEREAVRISELGFLPPAYIEEARALSDGVRKSAAGGGSLDAVTADARAALNAGNALRASDLYARAVGLAPASSSLWLRLAESSLAAESRDWQTGERLKEHASAAAVNAYLRAETETERSSALAQLGRALAARAAWRPAIRATRAALELADDPELRAAYDKLIAEHGFRITGHRVDSDAASPRICLELSDPLPRRFARVDEFVSVEGGDKLALEAGQKQICVDGVVHGGRYRIRVRAGLPAADGELLPRTADLDIYVRDRRPAVRFLGRAYVLPRGGAATIPVMSVNSEQVQARLYRVGDRGLARTVVDDTFLKQLSGHESEQIAEQTGEQVWQGTVEVRAELNREVTTALPVGALIDRLEPGAYALTAWPAEAVGEDHEVMATQWFVVSDLGLATLSGNDGLHVLVRSLSSAGPVGDVSLRLVARNDEVLGRAPTDAAGYARFDPGLLRGSGGNAPALLVAEGRDGDYGLLDLTKTPFDLSDRGVEGRPAPKPMDVFFVSERGIYRPGETVHLTALARNARADAVPVLPLTVVVKRPDGVEHARLLTEDQGLGGRHLAFDLLPGAMRGTWQAAVHADPQGPALASLSFLVEDFEPERLALALASSAALLDPADPAPLAVDVRFLYGAPAPNLALEGEVLVRATDVLAAHPRFRFGLASEEVESMQRAFPAAETDADGKARLIPALPELMPTSRPLEAELRVRVVDTGGRPVERALTLPVADPQVRLGIRPLFDGAVGDGGTAGFEVIAVGTDGARVGREGLRWTLSRVHRSFQWYEMDGKWDYEPVVTRERVASGNLSLDGRDTGRVEARVGWGGYELEVTDSAGGALPASVRFEAGWYVAPTAVDTPDLVKVSLDQPRYRVGETARVHIEPRFPGLALVMVVDDRLVAMTPAEVPAQGATVELPVTADWGPGAYVTAILFRPMDLDAKRMPGRSLGLAWAGVDPGERRLQVELDAPARAEPRGPVSLSVALGNLPAGEEAYVTVAAVDVGILNLTRYQTPAPDEWYFGQRALGMEIRDLYGQLIDRMQGVPGTVRSGGGAGLMRFEGPPPTEALVAFHSGILRSDARGAVSVAFDLPDFNGTVRVMAMAWSASGVGHAARDLLVRDPVVVTASLPRFLAPGDQSRVLLDLRHVEGPIGEVTLAVEGPGILTGGTAMPRSLNLGEGGRARVSVPIRAEATGDHPLLIRLTTPDGRVLDKRLTVPVRDNAPEMVRSSSANLAPGASLVLDSGLFEGLMPGTGAVTVSAGAAVGMDVPALLRALDRNPFGCAEQITSRALPLLYLNQVALTAGLGGDADAAAQVRDATARVLGKQSSDGGFGLWGPGGGDLWLDAYVTDFLTRAREGGHEVPEAAFGSALDNLRNRLAYAPDFDQGGEDIAYALYVLARNGRAAIGDLRYYAESKLEAFATPMARAQMGAALALYGERLRSDAAFRSAESLLDRGRDEGGWRADFGSELRDAAALLALSAEAGSGAVDRPRLALRVGEALSSGERTSTQENAWLLLAVHALDAEAAGRFALGDEVVEGVLYRGFSAADIDVAKVIITNRNDVPAEALITVSGVPVAPPPAGGRGYTIERAYYDLDGRRIDASRVAQGERLVAVVTVSADRQRAARLILSDPLPAGFEIENPNLVRAGDIATIPWLGLLEAPAHKAFHADRLVAAVERGAKDGRQFQLAYVVRAVSPGVFEHPPATVEDMYRPARRAWTGGGRVEVVAPAP